MDVQRIPTDLGVALQRAIDKILLEEWDPIGVGKLPQCADEYRSYVGPAHHLLVTASERELADYLWWAQTTRMGLRANRDRAERVARRLVELKRATDAR